MYSLMVALGVLCSIFLIIIVLMQSSKGGGLAGTFGGAGNFGTMFGTRRTADFLSKATWWLAGVTVLIAILINLVFLPGKIANQKQSIIQQGSHAVPTQPVVPKTK